MGRGTGFKARTVVSAPSAVLDDLERCRVLHQICSRSLVAETVRDHVQVAGLLEVSSRRGRKPPPHNRLRDSQIGRRHQEFDSRFRFTIGFSAEGCLRCLDCAFGVACHEPPLDFGDANHGPRFRVDLEEEIDRAAGPLGDQLERLARRLGFARLDEVDRGPADVASRHLAEAEAGLLACLFDRTRSDLHTTSPAATAA